jgi:hypothetical protein
MAEILDRLSPLQREITDALITGDDRSDDEGLAERHGMTPGAIRIERIQALRFLQEALGPELAHVL